MGWLLETLVSNLLLVLAAGLGFLVWKLHSVTKFFRKSGIKMDSHWQLLTLNIRMMLLKVNFLEFIDEIYQRSGEEKLFGYYQFLRPVVMVKDPELVERILIKDFTSFHDHGIEVDLQLNPLDGNLFNMSGGQWRALRNRLSPVFTSGRLRNMLPLVSEKAEKLVDVLPRGEDVLIRDFLSRYAIDVIGTTAFGIQSEALENPECDFKVMAKKVFRPGRFTAFKLLMRFFSPKLIKALKMKAFDREVEEFFFSITKQAFEHRTRTGEKRGDFVDLLLQLRGRGKLEVEGTTGDSQNDVEPAADLVLTDELLTAQSFIFLAAGWETAATGMMYVVYLLAKHQHVQDKLRKHLLENKVTDYDSMKRAKYLDACVSEALRLQSPAGGLFRICNRDYPVPGTTATIEKGTLVTVPSYSMQRDPKYFQDPLEYRPERFLENGSMVPGTYTPFGEGPRICIAERFAKLEIRIAIARLVENFKIKLSPKTKEPIKMSRDALTLDVEGGLWVTLEDIKKE